MADTNTTNILLTNQTEGGNNNTWGTIADANFEQIDNKFGDVIAIETFGGDTVLSSAQEIVNSIGVSGALASAATLTFSGRGGSWVVANTTSGDYTVTCKVSGQTGVVVPQGSSAIVYFNGTDIALANPSASASEEVTVASATTADVLGAGSEFVAVSGTTTITSFGTGANTKRIVRATGAFKITHNATTLICPGAVDLTTIAGDTFTIISDSSSNVRIYHYQRSSFVPSAFPVGAVIDYGGTSAPALWLLCYGQAVSRTTYPALFTVLGTSFGPGDSVTTFNVPDFRGRVSAGKDNMGGTSANRLTDQSGGLDGDTLGDTGGSETHALIIAELATHTHTGTTSTDGNHTHSYLGGTSAILVNGAGFNQALQDPQTTGTGGSHNHTFTTASTGSGTAHNNVQPTIILNKIIFAGA